MDWNNVDVKKAEQLLAYVSKENAVELIEKVIIPTVGSERDISFWRAVIRAINDIDYNDRMKESKKITSIKEKVELAELELLKERVKLFQELLNDNDLKFSAEWAITNILGLKKN